MYYYGNDETYEPIQSAIFSQRKKMNINFSRNTQQNVFLNKIELLGTQAPFGVLF
jgi:hypothetical protein